MTSREERARARDEALQKRAGATPHDVGVLSPGYVQCEAGMHPDHRRHLAGHFVATRRLRAAAKYDQGGQRGRVSVGTSRPRAG